MSDTQAAIHVEGLRKSFGHKEVLRGVDLDVPQGSIFGFLGLNGAGKTTLIRIMTGLLRADAGRCRVADVDPATDPVEVRRRIGYMAENQAMYAWMTVGYIIDWVGRFYPTWDAAFAEKLRGQMKLSTETKVGVLSKGQASRLALLLSLAHHPQTVILDDPTLGLDPVARREFLRDVIGHLQASGATVFFSSHLLYEIEPICDRIAILRDGLIIRSAGVDDLREHVKRVLLDPRERANVAEVPGLLDVEEHGGRWALTVADLETAKPTLEAISRNGLSIVNLNLDEIFEAYVIGKREQPAVTTGAKP